MKKTPISSSDGARKRSAARDSLRMLFHPASLFEQLVGAGIELCQCLGRRNRAARRRFAAIEDGRPDLLPLRDLRQWCPALELFADASQVRAGPDRRRAPGTAT